MQMKQIYRADGIQDTSLVTQNWATAVLTPGSSTWIAFHLPSTPTVIHLIWPQLLFPETMVTHCCVYRRGLAARTCELLCRSSARWPSECFSRGGLGVSPSGAPPPRLCDGLFVVLLSCGSSGDGKPRHLSELMLGIEKQHSDFLV